MKRLLLFASGLLCIACSENSKTADKPNIVIIMSDDQGWGDLSLHGNTNVKIPSPDRVERHQVYEKEFKNKIAGVIHVEQGKYNLILRPITIAGRQMMDINSISLKLL